jgi:hypothetical protein
MSNEGNDIDPAFSPDGRKLAFASDQEAGNFNIYLLDLASGEQVRVTGGPSQDFEPAWSPDGSTLSFHGYPKTGGSANLRFIQIAPTLSGAFTRRKGDELAPSWAPDGKRVVFQSRGGCTLTCPFDLWVHNITRAQSKRLTSGRTRDTRPVWQPSPSDLGVRLTPANTGPVLAGNELAYVIEVENRGPGTAWSVSIEHLPVPGVELLSVAATRGPCSGTEPIVCSIERLGPGGKASVRVVTRPLVEGVLELVARSTSLTFDQKSRNNVRRVPVAVAAPE